MKYYVFILLLAFIICMPLQILAGSGCCSWHDGQDYCDEETGRWVCKDGTYSSTCKCNNSVNNKDKTTNTNHFNIEDNFLLTIIVGITGYYLFKNIIPERFYKNKIMKIFMSIAFWILALTSTWLIIPVMLGLHGHFVLEFISIAIIIWVEKAEY